MSNPSKLRGHDKARNEWQFTQTERMDVKHFNEAPLTGYVHRAPLPFSLCDDLISFPLSSSSATAEATFFTHLYTIFFVFHKSCKPTTWPLGPFNPRTITPCPPDSRQAAAVLGCAFVIVSVPRSIFARIRQKIPLIKRSRALLCRRIARACLYACTFFSPIVYWAFLDFLFFACCAHAGAI